MNASNRTISTVTGRKIRILQAGQPDGAPVLVLRGTPQSRLLYDGWIADAQSRGIRLISYERRATEVQPRIHVEPWPARWTMSPHGLSYLNVADILTVFPNVAIKEVAVPARGGDRWRAPSQAV